MPRLAIGTDLVSKALATTAWEREERSFMAVAAVVRDSIPRSRKRSTSCQLDTGCSESPFTTGPFRGSCPGIGVALARAHKKVTQRASIRIPYIILSLHKLTGEVILGGTMDFSQRKKSLSNATLPKKSYPVDFCQDTMMYGMHRRRE